MIVQITKFWIIVFILEQNNTVSALFGDDVDFALIFESIDEFIRGILQKEDIIVLEHMLETAKFGVEV